jgi:hypothetical protein
VDLLMRCRRRQTRYPHNSLRRWHLSCFDTLSSFQALRLCAIGLLGKQNQEKKHGCVKHVVPTTDTALTHTDAGQNVWEESQNVLDRQVPIPRARMCHTSADSLHRSK